MNNIFNFKRFGLVLRKDLMENYNRYMLLFLTMLGIMTIVLTWQSWDYYSAIKRNGSSYVNLNIVLLSYLSIMFGTFGLIFASTFMSPMNSRIKRATFLVSPSSNFEKFLSRWIIITIGYIAAFFATLWIAETLCVGICSARFPDLEIKFLDLTRLTSMGNDWENSEYLFEEDLFMIIISLYFLFQSIFILGSTFWEKAGFIKTFTVGTVIILAFIQLCRWTILFFYEDFSNFTNVLHSFESTHKGRAGLGQIFTPAITLVILVFTLTNWILAFFRLRESEVIKRF
ncbi:MAG: hypothetical protein LBH77_00815 [Tannerella sp.]|jgi:hypothetical protein|nr:hypothetical protein [Tannerella sp.]